MSFKDSRELGFEECKELMKHSKTLTVMLPKESCRDFPCGPVVKTMLPLQVSMALLPGWAPMMPNAKFPGKIYIYIYFKIFFKK